MDRRYKSNRKRSRVKLKGPKKVDLPIDLLMKQLQTKYEKQRISFDNSYFANVRRYSKQLTSIPKLAKSQTNFRNDVIKDSIFKISERAARIAHEKNKEVVDSRLFNEVFKREPLYSRYFIVDPMPRPCPSSIYDPTRRPMNLKIK